MAWQVAYEEALREGRAVVHLDWRHLFVYGVVTF